MHEFVLAGDEERKVREAGFELEPGTDFIWLCPDQPDVALVLRWDGALSRARGLPWVYAVDPRRRAHPLVPVQVERKPGPVPRRRWWSSP